MQMARATMALDRALARIWSDYRSVTGRYGRLPPWTSRAVLRDLLWVEADWVAHGVVPRYDDDVVRRSFCPHLLTSP